MCKTSYNEDKLILFFSPEIWGYGHPLWKYESNKMIINSVAISAKKLKKFGNCVGFSNSRSERVKIMNDKTKGY